jgi:hypothetical protein
MASANASYGYVDVNVETPQVASGLAECVHAFVKQARPRFTPTMLHRFTVGGGARARWDGSKFYTNFQVLALTLTLTLPLSRSPLPLPLPHSHPHPTIALTLT